MEPIISKIFLISLICFPLIGSASSGSRSHQTHSASQNNAAHSEIYTHPDARSTQPVNVPRDSRGRIKRSTKAKNNFKLTHPCPANGKSSGICPGYVIDHVVALKRGGPDSPSNMQWQTIKDAKAKDKIE